MKKNSVSYSGQVARHVLHDSLKKLSSKGNGGGNAAKMKAEMMAYFGGSDKNKAIVAPVDKGDFNIKQATMNELSKGKNLSGNYLPGVPEQHLSTYLRYNFSNGWSSSLQSQYVGALYADDDNQTRVADYFLANIRLWKSFKTISFFGGINNLLNRAYFDNIRINAVSPGQIDTPMLAGPMAYMEGLREQFERRILMGRLGQASEVANAVAFLLSDHASYITASELVVDGGNLSSQR